jgi:16S rRNA processing protein RimM
MCPGDIRVAGRVTVGVVLKPVGLKGELKVRPMTDNPGRYAPGSRLYLTSPEGEAAAFTIKSVSEHKGNFKVAFEGIGSVGEAEVYRGQEVFVPENEVPPLPEGEYYHFQIIGIEVYTHSGRLLGTVREILEAGEKDVYVVRGGKGGTGGEGGGREYLIPVNENTVRNVDIKGGRMDLYPMEGYIPEDDRR